MSEKLIKSIEKGVSKTVEQAETETRKAAEILEYIIHIIGNPRDDRMQDKISIWAGLKNYVTNDVDGMNDGGEKLRTKLIIYVNDKLAWRIINENGSDFVLKLLELSKVGGTKQREVIKDIIHEVVRIIDESTKEE